MMEEIPREDSLEIESPAINTSRTWVRVLKYATVRLLTIFLTIVIGVFLFVAIANQNSFIDVSVQKEIDKIIRRDVLRAPGFNILPLETRTRLEAQAQQDMAEQLGLALPYWPRQILWTFNMLTFNWGDVQGVVYDDLGSHKTFSTLYGSSELRLRAISIVQQHFPNTLLIIGIAYLIIFSLGLPFSLYLSQRYGSNLDKAINILSPLSSVPSWIYGILLVSIFAVELRWLPLQGMFDTLPPANNWEYVLVVGRHLILPVTAVVLSMFFQIVYTWRTYFVLYSEEDYVNLGIAKGLSSGALEKNYILKPSLPYIITSFSLTLVTFWQMTTALEYYFSWPGIGWAYIQAIKMGDLLVAVGIVVIFAYLLGALVFILDVVYAIVDPRIQIHISSTAERSTSVSMMSWLKNEIQGRNQHLQQKTRLEVARPAATPFGLRLKNYFGNAKHSFEDAWLSFSIFVRELFGYSSAVLGLVLIFLLVAGSIYAVVEIPYQKTDTLWYRELSGKFYRPMYAEPVWVNWFRKDKLPDTFVLDSRNGSARKSLTIDSSGNNQIALEYTFELPAGDFPEEIYLYFYPDSGPKNPFATLTWFTPDGREIPLKNRAISPGMFYLISEGVSRRLLTNEYTSWGKGGFAPVCALIDDPTTQPIDPLPGTYRLRVDILTFQPGDNVDAELVSLGQVYGAAGTDHLRRDLRVALLWGLPVSLAIGLFGATTSTLLALIISAIGTWRGGWLDALIQRITEANMILPVLAIGVLLALYFSLSLWTILAIIILLNAFGSSTKSYRAAFLQVKGASYIEAARAYGASDTRIIFFYMIPRILPILVPQLVMLIPSYVFLEATLAMFGVSDPYLPTWGRMIYDALHFGAFRGYYYWILQPISLLLLTGLAFSIFGFALDRMLNPRLRSS